MSNQPVSVSTASPPALSPQADQTPSSSHPPPAAASTAPALSHPSGAVTIEGAHGYSHWSDQRTAGGMQPRGYQVGPCHRCHWDVWDKWGWHVGGRIGYVVLHNVQGGVPQVPLLPVDCTPARNNVGGCRPWGSHRDQKESNTWSQTVTRSLWGAFSPVNGETLSLDNSYSRYFVHLQLCLCLGKFSLGI